MKRLHIVFGAILVLISVFCFIYAGTFKSISGQTDIGPGAFPRFICVCLMICGGALIVREMKNDSQEKAYLFNRKLAISVAAILVYFLVLKPVGFIVSGIGIVFVETLILLNEPMKKAWPLVLGVSVGTPVVLYLIFGIFLKVPLPHGILAGILG